MVYPIMQYTDFTKGLHVFKCHTASWYMHKCNFVHARKKSMAFVAPVFTKFTRAQYETCRSPTLNFTHTGQ
jgi:hypothetical protein